MLIEFKTLTFKNILSFGNKETTIDFTQGLNLVTGANGSGKSSAILDTLSFCLYGKPYRTINLDELVNRKNKKGLEVTCDFVVDSKVHYRITRKAGPTKLTVWSNTTGKEFTDEDELELLSSKRLNQSEIDKIVGINYKLFKQIISLSINYNKPFLSGKAGEKRDIIEQIFNIKVFGEMLKLVKKETSDIRIDMEINHKTLALLKENIKGIRRRLKELTEAKDNFTENKQKDLENSKQKIADIRKNIKTVEMKTKKKTKILDKGTKFNIDDMREKREYLISKINECEYKIKTAVKTSKSLNKNQICPMCNTEITEEHKLSEETRLSQIIEDSELKIDEYKIIRNEIETDIKVAEQEASDIVTVQHDIKRLNDNKKMLDESLEENIKNRTEIKSRKLNIDIETIQTECDTKVDEYKIIHKEYKKLGETVHNNDIASNILSENGIKSYLFKKLIPILNKNINDYLTLFELPINLQFDEYMDETIKSAGMSESDFSYYSFSEGEKKRIDMAILLSFINITKTLANWNCNLLIIDELLDSAIDETGLEKLLRSLKNMTYDSNTCIYIISHRLQQEYLPQFKQQIKVEKNSNGFSKVNFMQ